MTSQPITVVPASATARGGISKFSNFADGATTTPSAVPHFDTVNRLGTLDTLVKLSRARRVIDTRSHEHLRLLAVGGYAVAIKLSERDSDWAIFCKDRFWNGVRQRPIANQPKTILRHTLVRVFGKGDARASQWHSRLKEYFSQKLSSQQVYERLQRKDGEKPLGRLKGQSQKRERVAVSIKPSKKFLKVHKLGLLESGEGMAVTIDAVDGACALVALTVSYADSRAKPTPLGTLHVRKVLQGAKPRTITSGLKHSTKLAGKKS